MANQRYAKTTRQSAETQILVEANLDGSGCYNLQTGIGFFDHMLSHLAKQSFIDLTIEAKGDTHIDSHHTIEDTGIVLGSCLAEALGTKDGIKRYGFSGVPMDETLVYCSIRFVGRAFLNLMRRLQRTDLGYGNRNGGRIFPRIIKPSKNELSY